MTVAQLVELLGQSPDALVELSDVDGRMSYPVGVTYDHGVVTIDIEEYDDED